MAQDAQAVFKLSQIRKKIAASKFASEEQVVEHILSICELSKIACKDIEMNAIEIVNTTRSGGFKQPILDAFLQEYGLSNQEGVALMCLAEALLRVPDKQTRDALIADKIAPGKWLSHIGNADTVLVNASTWGLMLTGRIISLGEKWENNSNWLGRLTNQMGEPIIRNAVMQAMRIMGGEFVLGQTIDLAIKRGNKLFGNKQIYSFDMLGEGARTFDDGENYFKSYLLAIKLAGNINSKKDINNRSGISVKLSALYPRYEYAHKKQVLDIVGNRLLELANEAARLNIKLTVDAEEADRLDLSLDIFEKVAQSSTLKNWNGFGLAIQAYSKRALPVIQWVAQLANNLDKKFMVRLVKGAYWDSEIKHAQELGLTDFSVFTRKSTTDLSYMVCAQELLRHSDRLFPQFATHNAHTIAAIMQMAGKQNKQFEFQRLHGMGELVYKVAEQHFSKFPPVRIYAPVGGHKDLLAYLVRRLLENGANSSFVNRFMDANIPAVEVVKDPLGITANLKQIRHPKILLPKNIFGQERDNSKGIDITSEPELKIILSAVSNIYNEQFDISKKSNKQEQSHIITNPANNSDILGKTPFASSADIDLAFDQAAAAQPNWDIKGGKQRAEILNKAADKLENEMPRLAGILIREAGKTYPDCISEIREAVDFCRYYSAQATKEFTSAQILPGPTGEANSISLHGRGVFLCISPWNFPIAIFLGQIAAALASGNAVIAKPAEQTPLIALETIRILHEAGVPKDILSLVLGDASIGAKLVAHPKVAGIAFTGGTQTAKIINKAIAEKSGPIIPFIAETGGQNVMFVDSTALLEQVSDDVIESAFGSAGQRCSALRVLYLQEEIADKAITMIKGAMDALIIGDPRNLETDIGPIIDKNSAKSLDGHIKKMQSISKNYHSIKLGKHCKSGTFIAPHLFEIENIGILTQEHFGPILHVIRYKASDLQNIIFQAFSTGYGLTLGVHTRMDRRWEQIFVQAPVGNTYINRNMVGAVVGSQPFGGQGLSGTGFKAGGPRYLYRFATEKTLCVNTMASGGNAELLTLS